jgi:hypothetical protein
LARLLTPEFIESWAGGVITSLEVDAIPASASPRGLNAELRSAGGGRAAVAKRRGVETANATAITGATAILGQHEFKRRAVGGATFTTHHLVYSQNGRLDVLKSDGTTEAYDSTDADPFTSGDTPPDFAVVNNECWIVNGVENKKATTTSDGASRRVRNIGLARPSAPTLGDSGTGMTGTYEIVLAYRNSLTGHTSSRSDATSRSVTNKTIDVTIPTSIDAQITHVVIGIRKTGLQTEFFELATVTAGTSTYAVNVTDGTLTALTTLMPDTAENDAPPVLSVAEFHLERVFAAGPTEPSKLLFSQLFKPESFDPENYEPISADDGDSIVALKSAFGILVIFKRNSLWALYGDDPNTWEIRLIDSKIGTTSHRSVVFVNGTLYWWSEVGPVAWSGDGKPLLIGQELIADTLSADNLRYAQYHRVCAEADITNERILWAVNETSPEGEPNFTNNNALIPFNYALQRFESTKWDPLDTASLGVVADATDVPRLFIGGYYGQLFEYGSVDADGAESGTVSGTVTSATNGPPATLTDSTAAFMTTGAGLKGRYVYVAAPGGQSVQRRRIISNTATVLTLDTGLQWNIVPNEFYTYVIGGPDWQWDTYVAAQSSAFWKKRFRFLFCQLKTEATEALVSIDLLFDYSNSVGQTLEVLVVPGGGKWDSAVWDVDRFGAQAAKSERLRVGGTGYAWRARFRNGNPNEPVTLLKVGMSAELLTEKLG